MSNQAKREDNLPIQNAGKEDYEMASESNYSRYDTLNYGSRVQTMKSHIALNENLGTRTQQEYEEELKIQTNKVSAQYGRTPASLIDVKLNNADNGAMEKHVKEMFSVMKESNGKVDATRMKALMAMKNVQNHNPLLFKRINDFSKGSKALGMLDDE